MEADAVQVDSNIPIETNPCKFNETESCLAPSTEEAAPITSCHEEILSEVKIENNELHKDSLPKSEVKQKTREMNSSITSKHRKRSESGSRSRRRSRSRSHRHHSHSRSQTRSSHSRRDSSRTRSKEIVKAKSEKPIVKGCNTLFDVIRNAEESLESARSGIIPNFDLIEPRYAYGKDLYIGNIQEGCFEEDVIEFLNKAMITANLNKWPGQPVISCRILPKFCFVSLRHEDEATNALNIDGIMFHGSRLKINRPVDYGGPETDHRTWYEICPEVSWKEMYDVYGSDYKWILKELENVPQEVIDICAGMDGAAITCYLELVNIVRPMDLEAVQEFPDLIAEIRGELIKYGNVDDIVIAPKDTEYSGMVYVKYSSPGEAKKASDSLKLRMFDNRLLGINFYSETQWQQMIKITRQALIICSENVDREIS